MARSSGSVSARQADHAPRRRVSASAGRPAAMASAPSTLSRWAPGAKSAISPRCAAALAASVPDSGGVTLLPALSGLGAPYWKPEATAALTGMTFATTRAHLARAALESVSLVTLFDEATPVELMKLVRPDLYVKGGDYDVETLAETALVRSWGGEARALPFLDGYSTTSLVERIRR